MPEVKSEERYNLVYQDVTYQCDDCGKGEMKSTGSGMSTGWSTSWDHTCSACGKHASFNTQYPKTISHKVMRDIE